LLCFMVKKKSNNSKVLLILTILFLILGVVLIRVNVYEYVQEHKVNNDVVESGELSTGGIVSINIVENPEKVFE